jgi:hypothetical protein
MELDKLKSILEWPAPLKLKELQSFLGLYNYYRQYIKDYSKHTVPLTDLIKKDKAFI